MSYNDELLKKMNELPGLGIDSSKYWPSQTSTTTPPVPTTNTGHDKLVILYVLLFFALIYFSPRIYDVLSKKINQLKQEIRINTNIFLKYTQEFILIIGTLVFVYVTAIKPAAYYNSQIHHYFIDIGTTTFRGIAVIAATATPWFLIGSINKKDQ